MQIHVFTIFPQLIDGFVSEALLGKAAERGLVSVQAHDIRAEATGVHRSVDDTPFGGGAGMVMSPEPIFAAVERVDPPRPLLLLSPAGRPFTQSVAQELSELPGFSLLCGRYEGIDHRVHDHLIDGELSIGDYVLAGGEVAALAVIEAVARLVPGVMGNATSAHDESFDARGLLEYPQYTRPAEFRDWSVPEVLRGGNHGRIERWRHAQALLRTMTTRPDLLERRGGLTPHDQAVLAEFGYGGAAGAADQ